VIEDCKAIRDKLREIKSYTEGSAIEFESVSVGESLQAKTAVQKLRQILLQHVATSLTPDMKQTLLNLLNIAFASKLQQ
jgi:3-deoxy-D-manno-octulosonic-acid transferase